MISKEMKNLAKLWKVDPEITPHLEKYRKCEKIRYYIAKYKENSIGKLNEMFQIFQFIFSNMDNSTDSTVFEENVKEVADNDRTIQIYLIKKIREFSAGEAKIYANHYNISPDLLIDDSKTPKNNLEIIDNPIIKKHTTEISKNQEPVKLRYFTEFVPTENCLMEFKTLKTTYHSSNA
jgi:hypothetical protein